jgi:hypothetical protein
VAGADLSASRVQVRQRGADVRAWRRWSRLREPDRRAMSRLYFDGFVFTFRALGYAYESDIANSEAAGYVVDQRKTQALVGLVTGRYEHSAAAMTIRGNVNSFVWREGLDELFYLRRIAPMPANRQAVSNTSGKLGAGPIHFWHYCLVRSGLYTRLLLSVCLFEGLAGLAGIATDHPERRSACPKVLARVSRCAAGEAARLRSMTRHPPVRE